MTTDRQDARSQFEVPKHPGRRWGWVFGAVWLLYLGYPVSDLVAQPHPGWERAVGLVVTAVFAFGYLMTIRYGFARMNGAEGRLWWVCPIGLYAAALAMSLVVGDASSTYIVFAMTTSIMLWRPMASILVTLAAIGWTVYALPRLLGERPVIELGIILAVVAVLMFSIKRMQGQEAVIRRAHEDMAHLAVDAERARFSRDLHDIVGHNLTAIIVKAELARALAYRDPVAVSNEVTDIEELARGALDDVRRTVAGYREVTLAGELASARAVLDAAGITAVLPQAVDEVSVGLRELFGWVVREGVTNVVRHSRARTCRIQVTSVSVEVVDDGRGSRDEPGNGLTGLRERVRALDGILTAGTDGGDTGFRLAVTVPAPDRADREDARA